MTLNFKPPVKGERRGGRKKGTPNRVTATLKQMIIGALEQAGGQEYLLVQAKKHPQIFCMLVARLIPLELAGNVGFSIRVDGGLPDGESAAPIVIDHAPAPASKTIEAEKELEAAE